MHVLQEPPLMHVLQKPLLMHEAKETQDKQVKSLDRSTSYAALRVSRMGHIGKRLPYPSVDHHPWTDLEVVLAKD